MCHMLFLQVWEDVRKPQGVHDGNTGPLGTTDKCVSDKRPDLYIDVLNSYHVRRRLSCCSLLTNRVINFYSLVNSLQDSFR